MEGSSESFVNFLKFILVFAIVFYIGNLLKTDMSSRGVFGIEKQRKVLETKQPSQIKIFSDNPAAIRYAW